MAMSMAALALKIPTEADAYRWLEELRWGDRPVCPHCGSDRKAYFLKPRNGQTRATRTGAGSARRVWKCANCRRQFSVLTGTVFHGSKIPVRIRCFLVFEMAASKNGISAREVARKYDLCPRTAWHALHRLREAMAQLHPPRPDSAVDLLRGTVIADETYVGGNPANRHGHDPRQHRRGVPDDKLKVLALVSRETGEVRSRVIPNVRRETLRQAISEQVEMERTHLMTDQLASYKRMKKHVRQHSSVDHSAREYVRDGVTTNPAETYFSQLKRSVDGTHHHISREHLPRYLAHFDFLYSTCKQTDNERMALLVGRVGGRRLAYKRPRDAQAV
jgi:transposase-like protein